MIDARRLALMRDGTTFINTARGALVDHPAIEAELVSGRLHAVIDTTDPEILPPDSPLYDLPNVLLTPHIAGSIGRETERMLALAIDEIERHARNAPLLYEVRAVDWDRIA
jgi:phosphoglycerate dehydrogenase-like enzyme